MQSEDLICINCGKTVRDVPTTEEISRTGMFACRRCAKTIVKVQVSLFSSDGVPQVLVYNKDRKHHYDGDATKEILELMEGEPKRFFFAELPKTTGYIKLNGEAPYQDW